MVATDTQAIEDIVGPLAAVERGFVLGLLLTRGQAQREEVAEILTGPAGPRCQQAIRSANELSREGRLHLIRRLASEVLGVGPHAADMKLPVERVRAVLEGESDEILAALAQPTGDPLAAVAQSILATRTVREASSGGAVASPHDMRVELRRAVLSAMASPG